MLADQVGWDEQTEALVGLRSRQLVFRPYKALNQG